MDFIYFLGRFHVLVLHLPIGIILAALGLEWLTRRDPQSHYRAISPYLWSLASVSALATVILGMMHISEGGFTGPSADAHRMYGISLALVTTLVWVLCWKWQHLYEKSRIFITIILLVLVTLTGHYGGNLTHGSTYLVEYAPEPIRAMAGLRARRPTVENVAMADPYLDVIAPMLLARCSNCHNDDKLSGQFNVSSYQTTIEGGETGVAVVPGNSSESELYRRITLPEGHDDFMPAEGKTPLSDEQVDLLAWWIDAGTPQNITLGELTLNAEIEVLISNELGLGDNAGLLSSAGLVAADPMLVEILFQSGFLVRQVTQSDPRLIVSIYSPGKAISDEQLDTLMLAGDQIFELDLGNASLDDGKIAKLSSLTNISILALNNNALSDESVNILSNMLALESLNLYGNGEITDASVDTLSKMENLSTLFLWQTGFTENGLADLLQSRPDLRIEAGNSGD